MLNTSRFSVPKIFLIVFPFLFLLSCAAAGQPVVAALPESAVPRWESFAAEKADGLAYYAGKVSSPRLEFYALRIDLSGAELRVFATGGAGGYADILSTKVSSFVRDNNLLAGINALPFDPVSGREGEPRTNVGIVISNGQMISPPHPEFDALVFYDDGGAAIVAQREIPSAENIREAVGGFRRILEAGEPVFRTANLNDRHPRSAAGISSNGRFLYFLVIDGRRPGSAGATEAETALLLRTLGAGEGINFDGGGSSALAMRFPDGTVRVVNTPVHGGIPGRERAVAGCLGVGTWEQGVGDGE